MKIGVKTILLFLSAAAAALVLAAVFHSAKPMPEGTNLKAGPVKTGAGAIKFLKDVTYTDENGKRIIKQEIFDEAFGMIARAERFIIADIFLINSFQGGVKEEYRKLSSELASALAAKKVSNSQIEILVITDEINSIYGGIEPPEISVMKKAGVSVVYTNMAKMRDSNMIFSPFWRVFFEPWGAPGRPGGIIPNPLSGDGRGISIRSAMKMLNFRANHRKIIVADNGREVRTLVMTGNASDASSAHTNTAVLLKNSLWREIAGSELKIARFSGYKGGIEKAFFESKDAGGSGAGLSFLTEGAIAAEIEKAAAKAGQGDRIDVLMFFLSDGKIINSLVSASKRGAKVRIILDPNKDAFGMKKNGMPNRRSAEKLVKRSNGGVEVRWYDTHGEQCHAKMILVYAGYEEYFFTGSANMTRRNLRNYNLEADVLVNGANVPAIRDAGDFFEALWENRDMHCTVPYEQYKKESLVLGLWTDFQEMTGFCTF